MKKFVVIFNLIFVICFLFSCKNVKSNNTLSNDNLIAESTEVYYATEENIYTQAYGTTVNFYGWGGNELVNSWIDDTLTPYVKEKYGIKLNRVPMNIDEILSILLLDKQNNNLNGNVDLIWINGENFATAKENGLLYGPFTNELPNFKKYINEEDDEIKYDFATPIDGYESPYSKAQLVLIYDSAKIANPPKSADELLEYCKEHPKRFTYEALPGFTGSAFVRNLIYEKVGYDKLANLDKNVSKNQVREIIKPAIDYLLELNKYLWMGGKTFPATNEIVDSMFMDGTLDFSISYDPYHVSSFIENGSYASTCKAFVFDNGTIGNTNYVAIGFNSKNKLGAMCVADAILSVPMQASKMNPKVWGALPVLNNNKLTSEELKIFEDTKVGIGSLSQKELLEKRIPELPAYLVTIIEEIWSEDILNK